MQVSQDIETATTALQKSPIQASGQPDDKTRRYDRQLRLWATSGQSALESSRVLVISASATSTSILKNLVLPGIGHFTILDSEIASQEDVGNNFFLEGPDSIGKPRAREAVRLLRELNESVEGIADTNNISSCISDTEFLSSFNLIIAHNLSLTLLNTLSECLWINKSLPPLISVRSAGFLADFHIQLREHTIIDSHPEGFPSLRIDKPFAALLEHARSLDLENMNTTDHGHIPFVVILVRALDMWKSTHDGKPPTSYAERTEFKKLVLSLKKREDEENFDEAISQAYRAWTETKVPREIEALFTDEGLVNLNSSSPPFFHLLSILKEFSEQSPNVLPLTSRLPDMKADTTSYISLQKLYKTQADEEKLAFAGLVKERGLEVESSYVDEFVRNCHGLKIIRGTRVGYLDEDKEFLGKLLASDESKRGAATYIALTALSRFLEVNYSSSQNPTMSQLLSVAQELLPAGTDLPDELSVAIGEVVRAPTADLPNTAALLGGLVAQEAIKVITKQYTPVQGICVIDLIESKTSIL